MQLPVDLGNIMWIQYPVLILAGVTVRKHLLNPLSVDGAINDKFGEQLFELFDVLGSDVRRLAITRARRGSGVLQDPQTALARATVCQCR